MLSTSLLNLSKLFNGGVRVGRDMCWKRVQAICTRLRCIKLPSCQLFFLYLVLTCPKFKFNLIWKSLYRSSKPCSLLAISCESLHNSCYMAAIKGTPFDFQVVISLVGEVFGSKISISPLDYSGSDWRFIFLFFFSLAAFFFSGWWSFFLASM